MAMQPHAPIDMPDDADLVAAPGHDMRGLGARQRSFSGAVGPTILAVTALALALRLWGITDQSLWMDEVFSARHIHKSWRAMLTAGFVNETNPPLYYVLLRLWCAVFGDGELALRSLSAVASAATVPVVHAIGATLGRRRAGIFAALLFALAGLQIEYAQEARQYALLVFGLAIALLGLAKAITERDDAGHPPRTAATLFVVGMVVAVYAHNIAAIYWFAMDFALLIPLAIEARRRSFAGVAPLLRASILAHLVALLLCAPQLYAIIILRDAEGIA
jgi:uncharacterized membrane protein